jgi:hypothetical protein
MIVGLKELIVGALLAHEEFPPLEYAGRFKSE